MSKPKPVTENLYGVDFYGDLPAHYQLTWRHEVPDGYRGYPFRRWLEPGTESGDAYYDTSGEIREIVEVPVGAQHQNHLESVWKYGYPVAWRWFKDERNTMLRYNGIVFVKADW